MDGTGWGLCLLAGFGKFISGVEPLGSTRRDLVEAYIHSLIIDSH